MSRILIAGCGYIGSELGLRLVAEGHEVYGLSRGHRPLPAEIRSVTANLAESHSLTAVPNGVEVVFYTAAADKHTDDAYRLSYVDGVKNLLHVLTTRKEPLRRIFFTSSSGVYAQQDGEWVDECSETEPSSFSGRRILEGERLFLDSAVPSIILRLTGIYGPGRTSTLDRIRQGKEYCRKGSPLYTNRIHQSDCVGALCHLMNLPKPDPIYLGVDNEPIERNEFVSWLAARMGVSLPENDNPYPDEERIFRSNKRCSNYKLVSSGYKFLYPSFREGFEELL